MVLKISFSRFELYISRDYHEELTLDFTCFIFFFTRFSRDLSNKKAPCCGCPFAEKKGMKT